MVLGMMATPAVFDAKRVRAAMKVILCFCFNGMKEMEKNLTAELTLK